MIFRYESKAFDGLGYAIRITTMAILHCVLPPQSPSLLWGQIAVRRERWEVKPWETRQK